VENYRRVILHPPVDVAKRSNKDILWSSSVVSTICSGQPLAALDSFFWSRRPNSRPKSPIS
jgi:hypothetical protein